MQCGYIRRGGRKLETSRETQHFATIKTSSCAFQFVFFFIRFSTALEAYLYPVYLCSSNRKINIDTLAQTSWCFFIFFFFFIFCENVQRCGYYYGIMFYCRWHSKQLQLSTTGFRVEFMNKQFIVVMLENGKLVNICGDKKYMSSDAWTLTYVECDTCGRCCLMNWKVNTRTARKRYEVLANACMTNYDSISLSRFGKLSWDHVLRISARWGATPPRYRISERKKKKTVIYHSISAWDLLRTARRNKIYWYNCCLSPPLIDCFPGFGAAVKRQFFKYSVYMRWVCVVRNLNIDRRIFVPRSKAFAETQNKQSTEYYDRITLRFSQLFIAVGHSFCPQSIILNAIFNDW